LQQSVHAGLVAVSGSRFYSRYMTSLHTPTLCIALLALFTTGASHAQDVLIYRGDTFAQQPPQNGTPLYQYDRRVASTHTGLTAAHTTRDTKGNLVITETAQYSADYALQHFETVNTQGGFSGTVDISAGGRHLEYRLNDNGKISTAQEDVRDPVVSGPTLFGFILKHWDPLQAGNTVPVRMLVLREKTTYGFDIRFEKEAGSQTMFTVTPSSFLIRLALAPLRVTFDTAKKTVVRYEGRVPPLDVTSGKPRDLDARVEYTMVTPAYR
jgi:hypothetical protein